MGADRPEGQAQQSSYMGTGPTENQGSILIRERNKNNYVSLWERSSEKNKPVILVY